jgi:hypothetical protein
VLDSITVSLAQITILTVGTLSKLFLMQLCGEPPQARLAP